MSKLKVIFLVGILSINLACKKDFSKPITEESFKSLHQTSQAETDGVDLSNYTFFGQDDFNGTTIDTSVWNYRHENVVRSNGFGSYGVVSRSNVTVSNGILRLAVNKLSDSLFGTAMIATEQSPQYWFKYGYYEIRARLPQYVGSLCAFWLQSPTVTMEGNNPSINGVEVDIFEYGRSSGADLVFHTLHWNGYGSNHKQLGPVQSWIPFISNGYHTFGLEWTPKEYIIYVDGIEKARTDSAVSHTPEFIILSAETGAFGGDPLKSGTTFPDYFDIDYVKVYKRKPAVTLYGQSDYYGWVSQDLTPGSYTTVQLEAMGVINNDASSIEVPAGWTVTIYDGDNFTGDFAIVTADARNSTVFDNRLSSLTIQDHY